MKLEVYPLSDQSITLYFEQEVSEKINELVLRTSQWIIDNSFPGFEEVVPAYASLTVYFDLLALKKHTKANQTAHDFVKKYLEKINFERLPETINDASFHEIPVKYDGEDIAFVAQYHDMSITELVEIHTSSMYRVFMMGFLPGFPYLGGLDARIACPRKKNPRLRVPAGSIGIGGSQTGIYPFESPGGWQLIGRTELELFRIDRQGVSLLKTGDQVKFVEI